jgi:hypothetical protein
MKRLAFIISILIGSSFVFVNAWAFEPDAKIEELKTLQDAMNQAYQDKKVVEAKKIAGDIKIKVAELNNFLDTQAAAKKTPKIVNPIPKKEAEYVCQVQNLQSPAPESSSMEYSESISIDFGNGGLQRRLRADEKAGVFSTANWNSADGAAGELSNLISSNGNITSANLNWAANNLYQVQDVNTGGAGCDYTMMFGYIDTSNNSITQLRVEKIPKTFAEDGFDLIVYVDGSNGSQSRVGLYEVAVKGAPPITKFVKDGAGQAFDGKFVEADTAAAPTVPADGIQGNMVIFRNIKSREFTLLAKGETGEGFKRAPINGIQILRHKK